MQTDNKLLDDLARVAASALGTLQGVRDEVEVRLRDQFERILSSMDLVTREEFDAVKAMATAARRENHALEKRIEALEVSAGGSSKTGSAARKRKGAAAGKKRGTRSTRKNRFLTIPPCYFHAGRLPSRSRRGQVFHRFLVGDAIRRLRPTPRFGRLHTVVALALHTRYWKDVGGVSSREPVASRPFAAEFQL